MMAKKQKVKAEHIILDRGEVQGQAQGRITMADSMVAPTGKYLTNQERYVSLLRSELAENEIIPSDIARDVKDILSNDSDQSDTDMGRDEYDYYQIGQDVMQEVFRTDSNHVITKKYDIQSFDEELMGHTIYKAIDKKTPAIFQPFLKWLYQNYYDAYSFARREFSIVKTLFWIYRVLGFILALTIKYLDILADIWRITVTGLISLVLKSDEVLTKVLDDRPRRKVN